MVKLIGAALVVAATTGAGLWKANAYAERVNELNQLITALQMLETEIAYGATPLPEALARIGGRVSGKIGRLLQDIGHRLERGDGRSAGQILQERLSVFAVKLHLRPQDRDILLAFGHTLGHSDRMDQLKHIRLTCARLSAEETIARDERQRLGKMWRYLGALLGLAAVIIMY